MKKIFTLLILYLAFNGCDLDEYFTPITETNASTLSGTYSLTGYLWYLNAECTGESIIDSTIVTATLTQLDYTYEFDGNSVTIIQVSGGIETFNQSCDYVIVSDIFTPSCYPYPHTISSNDIEFYWEFGTTSDVTVEGITETISVCYKYIITKQ